jgi:hypothetical protein
MMFSIAMCDEQFVLTATLDFNDSKQEHSTPGCYTGHQGVPKHRHLPKNKAVRVHTMKANRAAEV